MLGFLSTGWDRMDVDVQWHRIGTGWQDLELFDSRFLARFPECDGQRIELSIGMSTGLQPSIELGVMQEEDIATIPRDDPRRTGHMSLETGPLETIRTSFHEFHEPVHQSAFLGVTLAVPAQESEQ